MSAAGRPGRGAPWPALRALSVLFVLSVLSVPMPLAAADPFAGPGIEAAWARTDRPVAEGRVARPYVWGPAPFATRTERYDDAGGEGRRTVQYFDKGRLESVDPAARTSELAVLQGSSIVRDLALGLVQVGSGRIQLFDPAFVPVAGDDLAANPEAPRYVDFGTEVLFSARTRTLGVPAAGAAVGQPITATIQAGERGRREATAEPRVLVGAYDQESGHNIAAPFWEAFAASGPIVDPVSGREVSGPLYDWRLLVGAPLTEPTWAQVRVNGQARLLLVQLFERRVLTYRPDAPAGLRVEMGNSGRHYFDWRYGVAPFAPPAKAVAPSAPGRSPSRLSRPPRTPATPYEVETGVPASLNGAIAPGFGPAGTRHAVLLRGFYVKDLVTERIDIFFTAPNGRTVPLGVLLSLGLPVLSFAEERLDGLVLVLDTLILGPGVWAMTVQDLTTAERRAIIYARVTAEPPEAPLALVVDPLSLTAMASIWLPAELASQEGER